MINSILLGNFKCFQRQTVRCGSLTLLTGLNGMGKSSVLQALLLLRQSYEQKTLEELGLALNGELVSIGTAKDALYEGAVEDVISIGVTSSEGQCEWQFTYDSPEATVLPARSQRRQGRPPEFLSSDGFQYLSAERIGPRVTFEVSERAVSKKRLGKSGEYTPHLLAVHGRTPISNSQVAHPRAKSLDLIDQVEAWLSEISPGTRIHVTPYSGMDLVNVEFSFVAGDQVSNRYRPTNVGFGITYTLPILTALLAAPVGALLLIENPEAHLHPQGQVRMGEFMAQVAASGVQIISETHSDHILNGIRVAVHGRRLRPESAVIHFFVRDAAAALSGTSLASPEIDAHGRLSFWPSGFFDEWDKSLERLLGPVDRNATGS